MGLFTLAARPNNRNGFPSFVCQMATVANILLRNQRTGFTESSAGDEPLMDRRVAAVLVVLATSPLPGCIPPLEASGGAHATRPASDRLATLRRAQVWQPTDIPAMDVRTGPAGDGSFAPEQMLPCDYVKKQMHGRSPKFLCAPAPATRSK